jgi:hypothetical protein
LIALAARLHAEMGRFDESGVERAAPSARPPTWENLPHG